MSLVLPPAALRAAAHAWDIGGSMALGLWFSRYKPKFSVNDYAQLVQLVREELHDWTDYSHEGEPQMGSPRRGEYEIPDGARPVACRSCGAAMVFIKTAAGKALPLSLSTVEERDGKRYALAHFADCPQASEWSKR